MIAFIEDVTEEDIMTSVEIARKMEAEAIRFYEDAANLAKSPVGRKMFQSIANDERGHMGMLQQIIEGCALKITEAAPMKAVKTIFEEMKDEMMNKVAATRDEIDALKVAMEMERGTIEFYRKASAEAKTNAEKCLFDRLVQEEQEHHRIFSNTHSFLADTGNWYMWEEHSIVEG